MRAFHYVGVALCLVLAGCSSLPTSGPRASTVLEEKGDEQSSAARYSVVELDERVVDALRRRPTDASLASLGGHRGGAADTRVGVGDAVSLTIWEAGAGGLFSAGAPLAAGTAIGAGSHASAIPEQIVSRDGMIMVPYAGRVRAAGRSTSQIARQIENALQGKAIQPQALVTVTRPLSNTVTVIGESVNGARVPLSPKGDRVLDVVAQAGGVRSSASETMIQIQRGGRTARASMARIAADASQNVYVRPGDVITVLRDPEFFMALGATGRSADIPFDGVRLTLAQALSKAGGLIDSRADPEGVFVFRLETPEVARALGAATENARLGSRYKVAYHVNLRDPNQFFLAQQMQIFNRDLLYVSNATLSDAQKFMQLFSLVATPAAQGASIANVASKL